MSVVFKAFFALNVLFIFPVPGKTEATNIPHTQALIKHEITTTGALSTI